jgi:hypothetical protein
MLGSSQIIQRLVVFAQRLAVPTLSCYEPRSIQADKEPVGQVVKQNAPPFSGISLLSWHIGHRLRLTFDILGFPAIMVF